MKRTSVLVCALMLCLVFSLSAFAGEKAKIDSLKPWEGNWNNMGVYLEDPKLDEAYKALAKAKDTTPEDAKKAYLQKRECSFNGMIIKDNTVTFTSAIPGDKEAKELEVTAYAFKEEIVTKLGEYELHWHVFEAQGKSEYPVLMIMPVSEGEELVHFHMRYGKSVEEILAIENWFPTLVKPDSTMEQLSAEIGG